MATTGEDLEARDEDRLPWLETVEEDNEDGPGGLRVLLFVLLGLVLIAVILFALYQFQSHRGASGKGQLIAAQEGDYKVKPDEPGGMKVEGEGDTVFATSQGKGPKNAAIDLKAMPEAPVTPKKAATPPATDANAGASADANAAGGALVQLGSFPSQAAANTAWTRASKRFSYLAPLGESVQKAEVNGSTVYRVRVNAGSAEQATELCGKLKVAGAACFVPKN